MQNKSSVPSNNAPRTSIESPRSRIPVGLFVTSAFCSLAIGCAGVRSSELDATFDASRNGGSKGISYFLPTNSVRVVFTNETIASEINKATQALKDAEGAVSRKKEEVKKLEDAKNDAAGKPDELKKIEGDLEKAKSAQKELDAKVAEAKTAVQAASKANPQILVEELPPVPDTRKAYTANLDHGPLSDDTVTLKTSADGLLTSVDYRGDDQTGVVVQNLVKTAIETGKLYARLHGVPIGGKAPATKKVDKADAEMLGAKPPLPRCPVIPTYTEENVPEASITKPRLYYFENTIDPSDRDAVAAANRSLLLAPIPYLIDIRPPRNHTVTPSPADLGSKKAAGLLYRRSVPYDVVIYEDADLKNTLCGHVFDGVVDDEYAKFAMDREEARPKAEPKPDPELDKIKFFLDLYRNRLQTVRSAQMAMPAGGAVAWLDLSAKPFVETHITAEFAAGQLTSVTTSRPSEAVGFTEIPLNVVTEVGNAVGEVIDNVLPLQLKYTNDQTALLKAQAELLEEQQAYQDLLDAIRDGTYVPNDGGEGDQPESGPGTTPSNGTTN